MAAELVVGSSVDVKQTVANKDKTDIELPNHFIYTVVNDAIGSGSTSSVYKATDQKGKEYALKVSIDYNMNNTGSETDAVFMKKLQAYPWVAHLEGDWKKTCSVILPDELLFSNEYNSIRKLSLEASKTTSASNKANLDATIAKSRNIIESKKRRRLQCHFQLQRYYSGDADGLLSYEGSDITYLEQMCAICVKLGQLKIVHGDMKPDNFLVDGKEHLVVSDFEYSTVVKAGIEIKHGWTFDYAGWARHDIQAPMDPSLFESFAVFFNLCQLFAWFRDENIRWGSNDVLYDTFSLPNDPNFPKLVGLYPWLWFDSKNVYVIA
jgi:serine/threonine protein kinase